MAMTPGRVAIIRARIVEYDDDNGRARVVPVDRDGEAMTIPFADILEWKEREKEPQAIPAPAMKEAAE